MIAVETALYGRLAADATLTALLATSTSIYNTVAPEGVVAPFVVFSQQSHVDQWTLGKASAWEKLSYQVMAITDSQGNDTSSTTAETIAARFDVLLQDYALSVTGYTLMVCRRTSKLKYPELTGSGRVSWHVGSTYQIGVSS